MDNRLKGRKGLMLSLALFSAQRFIAVLIKEDFMKRVEKSRNYIKTLFEAVPVC
jgi:hypothetical protein